MTIRAWMAVVVLATVSCRSIGREDTHIIPMGVRGPVVIRFNQPNGTRLDRDWRGNVTYRIPMNGTLSVNEGPPGKGRVMRFVAISDSGERRTFPLSVGGKQVDVFGETFGDNKPGGYRYIAYIVGDPTDPAFVKRATSELWAAVSPPFGKAPPPNM